VEASNIVASIHWRKGSINMKENFNVWIGLRASDYQIFTDLVEIDQIVSIDTDDTKGIPLISREAISRRRGPWSNDELLAVSEVEAFQVFCAEITRKKIKTNIYCYHSFSVLEELARECEHIHIHSSPIELRDRLDDKLRFIEVLNTLALPQILSFSDPIDNLNFHEVTDKVGLPLVLKLKVGASGGQTYLVSTEDDFLNLQRTLGKETVIVSPYISGPSFNINGFIGRENVYLDQPSLQIIGVPQCSSGRFTYCGNDFAAFHKHHQYIADDIKQVAEKLGWYMKNLGYYGIFGVDFIYNLKDKVLYPLEINPRMQGSTALLARYQLINKASRLIELYVTETQPLRQAKRVDAAFVLLHNLSSERLKIETSFASGMYTFTYVQGKLKLTYLGDKTIFPTQKNEMLVLGCPPKGTVVEPGAGIVRLEFGNAILNKKGIHLKNLFAKLATDMYNMLWN
jgi:predicted ATP-grasp superfamily ATP-dependent carboligase